MDDINIACSDSGILVRGCLRGKMERFIVSVDDEDRIWLRMMPFRPCFRGKGPMYAKTSFYLGDRQYKTMMMHRLIMERYYGPLMDNQVDHIDGNTYDNRKSNLRVATFIQNSQNRKRQHNKKSSKYKGVFLSECGKYRVIVHVGRTKHCCGAYESERDAAMVYNLFVRHFVGEFARLNDIQMTPEDERRIRQLMNNPKWKSGASSKYLGVERHSDKIRWKAKICIDKRRIGLGLFATEECAAQAYNEAALKYRGDKARLNVIV